MSRAETIPTMMDQPVTEAVIEPRVDAASSTVDKCPMEITEAIEREYSSNWVLWVVARDQSPDRDSRKISGAQKTYMRTGIE